MTGKPLAGRSVLVAGGAHGIGRACALRLALAGARVAVADPGVSVTGTGADESAAARTAAEIQRHGAESIALARGIGGLRDGERIVAACVERLGALDVVVVPATVIRDAPIDRMMARDWEAVMRVNLTGLFGLLRAAAPIMRVQRYGRIVTFTSRSGIEGRADGASNYAAAKMGVIGLTKSVAKELGPHGVRANSVAPRARTRASEHVAEALALGGHGRPDLAASGTPEDVTNLVVYLASESCVANGRVFWCSGRQLGIYPEPVATSLSDESSALGIDEIAARVAAHLDDELPN